MMGCSCTVRWFSTACWHKSSNDTSRVWTRTWVGQKSTSNQQQLLPSGNIIRLFD